VPLGAPEEPERVLLLLPPDVALPPARLRLMLVASAATLLEAGACVLEMLSVTEAELSSMDTYDAATICRRLASCA
jgi:hypothetical protein